MRPLSEARSRLGEVPEGWEPPQQRAGAAEAGEPA